MHDDQARSQADDWNAHYRSGRPPWDLDAPAPALLDLLATLPREPQRVLVPCAGLGHDAIAWATAGYQVTAVDFAPLAVAGARQHAEAKGVTLTVLQADLFHLPPEFEGAFAIVWEQTCLCALDPQQRAAYLQAMARALRDGGVFYGLFWNHGQPGGPPYDLTPDLIASLIPPELTIEGWKWVEPGKSSRRVEFLMTLRKVEKGGISGSQQV